MKSGVRLYRILQLPLLIFWALFLYSPQLVSAKDVRLAWDPSYSLTLAGYRVCYGVASGQYETIIDVKNTTTYTVTGLTSGTYYFAVRAYSTAGEESAFSNEVSVFIPASSDTQPPAISGLTSLDITAASATIIWTTNELADSQVLYGTTPGYGMSTPLSSDLVASHSQVLSGLASGVTYHVCVKSRDAAGNLSVSDDYVFATLQSGATVPLISAIAVTNITNKSATVSWATDKASDSEVEYWIERATTKKAALRFPVTSHSLTLNHLQRLTQYHFRVKSADMQGNQANSLDLAFTTTDYVPSAFALPRFSAGQYALGDDTAVGLAFTNSNSRPDTLTFTAIEDNGHLTSGAGMANPVTHDLAPYSQFAIIDWQIFGNGYLDSNSNGWLKLNSDSGATSGFFLVFDSHLTLLDGANFSDLPLTNFAFTEIEEDGYNKINIINSNAENAVVDFQLVGADGNIRAAAARIIPNNGALTVDLFSDLFVGIDPDSASYVQVQSNKGVHSFQVMRQNLGDISTLAGQDVTGGETVLYSPQYVHGDAYRTSLSIINLDSVPGMVTLQFFREDGVQMGLTRTLPIAANGKLYIEDPGFFLPLDPAVITSGYVKIMSNGVRLAGSTIFGDRNRQSFSSALALISDLQTSVLFSHVASNDLYFTGLAILNPNPAEAAVTIELYDANGTLLDKTDQLIGPGRRKASLLTQYFPSMVGKNQVSGYFKLLSSLPVASFAALGTNTLSVLSAIPPQVIP
jgi:hypothetical protein